MVGTGTRPSLCQVVCVKVPYKQYFSLCFLNGFPYIRPCFKGPSPIVYIIHVNNRDFLVSKPNTYRYNIFTICLQAPRSRFDYFTNVEGNLSVYMSLVPQVVPARTVRAVVSFLVAQFLQRYNILLFRVKSIDKLLYFPYICTVAVILYNFNSSRFIRYRVLFRFLRFLSIIIRRLLVLYLPFYF